MKARVKEQLRISGAGGAASAVLTKVHTKVNIKNKKCSLATSGSAMEDADNQEVGAILERIQSLVPITNKNKTLSNLDIITSAIFYIRDLQATLGLAELELDTSVSVGHTEDNLDLISSSGTTSATSMETGQSVFPAKCSVAPCPSPAPPVSQCPTTTTSSSPPTMMTTGGDSLSPLSTIIRQRHPLSIIPSPNTPSASAANCHGYRISQKS